MSQLCYLPSLARGAGGEPIWPGGDVPLGLLLVQSPSEDHSAISKGTSVLVGEGGERPRGARNQGEQICFGSRVGAIGPWVVLGSRPLGLSVLVLPTPSHSPRVETCAEGAPRGAGAQEGVGGLRVGREPWAPPTSDGPTFPQGGAGAPVGAARAAPQRVPVGEGRRPGEGQPGAAGAAGQAAGREAVAQPEGAAAAGPGPPTPAPPGPPARGELPSPALPAPLQLLTSPQHPPAGLAFPLPPAPQRCRPALLPLPAPLRALTVSPRAVRMGGAVPHCAVPCRLLSPPPHPPLPKRPLSEIHGESRWLCPRSCDISAFLHDIVLLRVNRP